MKKPKKPRPSLITRLRLYLAERRSNKSACDFGLEAMIPPSLLAEMHTTGQEKRP